MKTSDHQKAVESLLQRQDDPVFCKAFFIEAAASHPTVFNRVCDKLVTAPLSPFKEEEWKVMVKTLLAHNSKLEAIKWLRSYSIEHPEVFPNDARTNDKGEQIGIGLLLTKNLVESLNKPE